MATERKSTSFRQEWWDNVANYLENHPEEGYDSNQVKEFIKVILNKYMANDVSMFTKEEIKMLKDMTDLDE